MSNFTLTFPGGCARPSILPVGQTRWIKRLFLAKSKAGWLSGFWEISLQEIIGKHICAFSPSVTHRREPIISSISWKQTRFHQGIFWSRSLSLPDERGENLCLLPLARWESRRLSTSHSPIGPKYQKVLLIIQAPCISSELSRNNSFCSILFGSIFNLSTKKSIKLRSGLTFLNTII